jgi:hypothetical protein
LKPIMQVHKTCHCNVKVIQRFLQVCVEVMRRQLYTATQVPAHN